MKLKVLLFSILYAFNLIAQKPYFQQKLDYQIQVKLNDKDHSLQGEIQIIYKNNSPDVLDKIGFHLWPNAYKTKSTAFAKQKLKHFDTRFYDAPESELGYIDQLSFTVNAQKATLNYIDDNPDMAWLVLPSILHPGDSIIIHTPFHVKLPESFSRLGHAGQTYQITQWYPKPAVYDRKGWHLMPYLDQGEFYSEFANFNVRISLPRNYVVGATGILQNAEEYTFLDKRIQETKEAIRKRISLFTGIQISDPEFKTLQYVAENVHDFAWFADKSFYVQKSQVTLASGKKVDTWTLFNDNKLWSESVNYVNRSIEFYSKLVGEYPWPQATAVESALSAGGGMEYPMITVIGPSYTKQNLDEVITHEVGHNWFYGILASNEREHPYMDEGINSYYERRYIKTYYTSANLIYIPDLMKKLLGPFQLEQLMYLTMARSYSDQHPNQHSDRFTIINYGNDVYFKTAALFAYAESALGTNLFDSIMKSYYQTWKFKHPYPEDLQQLFSEKTTKDMGWLFDGFLNSDQKMDYGFCNLKNVNHHLSLKIHNNGKIAAPFKLSAIRNDSIVNEKWIDGFTGKKVIDFPEGNYDLVAIDFRHESYDLYDCNNYIKTKGLFKKTEPFHIRMFPFLDVNGKTDLGITPMFGRNVYNGFMAGAFITGPWFPSRKFIFNLMPLYAFRNEKLAGQSNIQYTWYFPDHKMKSLTAGLFSKSYSYAHDTAGIDQYLNYYQLNPSLKIEFSHLPSSLIRSELTYIAHWIRDEYISRKDSVPVTNHINRIDHQLKYNYSIKSILGDFDFETGLNYLKQSQPNALKQELLRMQFSIEKSFRYKQERYFKSRFYLAFYPYNTERNNSSVSSRSQPNYVRGSTGLSYQNYLDDNNEELFLGRSESEGLWSQQISLQQGGFKLSPGAAQRNVLGNSNSFICSANFSADLPIKFFGNKIRPYLDIGYFEAPGFSTRDKFLYSAGISLRLIPGILDVYFPVIHSQNIKDIYNSQHNQSYWQQVCFSLKLKKPELNDLLHLIGY